MISVMCLYFMFWYLRCPTFSPRVSRENVNEQSLPISCCDAQYLFSSHLSSRVPLGKKSLEYVFDMIMSHSCFYPGFRELLRASALGAERVNGLWLSNAGGGAVNLLSRTFVNIAHRGYEDDGTWSLEYRNGYEEHIWSSYTLNFIFHHPNSPYV